MAKAAGPGLERTVHAPSGMEGPVRLNVRSMEYFDRMAARVFQHHDFEDVALGGLLERSDPYRNARLLQTPGHLAEFVLARDPQADEHQVVGVVLFEHDAVVPVIHAQEGAPGKLSLDDLQSENAGGELLPAGETFHPEGEVTKLRNLDHVSFLRETILCGPLCF